MPHGADLDELNAVPEMIDDRLMALMGPPFGGGVVFAAGTNDPEWNLLPREFPDLGMPGFFPEGKMDVSLEESGFAAQVEALIQKLDETVEAVVGGLVAAVNQRIGALDEFRLRVVVGQRGEVGVVLPQLGTRSADIRDEPSRACPVQIPDGGGEHDDVARSEGALQNQLFQRSGGEGTEIKYEEGIPQGRSLEASPAGRSILPGSWIGGITA